MNTEVSISIHKIPEDCPAFEMGNKYGYSVSGTTFGCASPVKNKEEIIKGIKDYISSEEEYHNCKLTIGAVMDESELNITKETIKGTTTLSSFF